MPAKPLKLVPPDERRQSVMDAADSGDRRALLVALRARISHDVDDSKTPARDLAALSRRLLEIAREIEAIDASDEGDDIGAAAATPDESWTAS